MLSKNALDRLAVTVWLLGGMLVAAMAASGCSRGRVYTASALPAEYLAMPVHSAHTLDLTQLSGPPVSSERIHAGDVLNLSIAGGLDSDAGTKFPVRVNDDGAVWVPEVGEIRVAGLEPGGAEQAIAMACIERGQFVRPAVNVTMNHQRVNRITMVGGVEKQGIIELPRGDSYLLPAIVAAGGLAEDAGTNVEIRQPAPVDRMALDQGFPAGASQVRQASATRGTRNSLVSMRVDLVEAVTRGQGGQYLEDGAVVMVELREPKPVEVIGLVNDPGQYEFPVNKNLNLLSALALAGGLRNPLADSVIVRRTRGTNEEPIVIKASIQKAKYSSSENVLLEPGDVVSVEKSAATVILDAFRLIRFNVGSSIPLF